MNLSSTEKTLVIEEPRRDAALDRSRVYPIQDFGKWLDDLPDGVKTWDLSGHSEVDDQHICLLAHHPKAKFAVNLDVSGTSITEKSIEYLRLTRILGSIRDLPQTSPRYDRAESVVYVVATGASNLQVERCGGVERSAMHDFPPILCDLSFRMWDKDQGQFRQTSPDDGRGVKRVTLRMD